MIKPDSSLHSFSALAQRCAYFFEHYFPQIIFAVAFPTIVSLIVFWTGLGVTLAQLNAVTSVEELASLFSWSSPTTYMILLMAVVLFCLNIIGLIAGPLVLIEHKKIRLPEILPRSLEYFFSYIALAILVVGALVIVYVVAYLLVTIISSIAGLIQPDWLDPTFNLLATILPTAGLIVIALFFMLAPFALIDQKRGAYQALLSSVTLVRLNFWPIVLREAIMISCVLIIGFLLLFIPYLGYALSVFASTLIMTVVNYVIYEDVTGTWR